MATSIMMVLLILHPCLSKLCMAHRFMATMFVVISSSFFDIIIVGTQKTLLCSDRTFHVSLIAT